MKWFSTIFHRVCEEEVFRHAEVEQIDDRELINKDVMTRAKTRIATTFETETRALTTAVKIIALTTSATTD